MQQQLLRLTLEGSGVGVWQWDIRSGVMKADERLEQMHGYALGTLPPDRIRNASGLFNLTRNLGGAVRSVDSIVSPAAPLTDD